MPGVQTAPTAKDDMATTLLVPRWRKPLESCLAGGTVEVKRVGGPQSLWGCPRVEGTAVLCVSSPDYGRGRTSGRVPRDRPQLCVKEDLLTASAFP